MKARFLAVALMFPLATLVAEAIRAILESRVIEGPDGKSLRATVSAGVALIDPNEPTPEALLRAADVGLFMAKRGGRNRVEGKAVEA